MQKRLSNLFLLISFVFIFMSFLILPIQKNTNANEVQLCGLLYDVGCEVYYCWAVTYTGVGCWPCGVSGCTS